MKRLMFSMVVGLVVASGAIFTGADVSAQVNSPSNAGRANYQSNANAPINGNPGNAANVLVTCPPAIPNGTVCGQPCTPSNAPATAGRNLVIGNTAITETPNNYLRCIKYLTVPPARQNAPAFGGNDIQAIKALEDPVRRQIYETMSNNRSDRFRFANLAQARQNFTMRVEAIRFMFNMEKGVNRGGIDFGYYGPKVPAQADRNNWRKLGVPEFAFTTLPGARAAEAIDGIAGQRFRGECLGAIEITLLQAARKAVGPNRFNALHAAGLEVGHTRGKSVRRHVQKAARIAVADMVPGDWVYMKNQDDYNSDLRPGARPGYWTGENAVYMGRYQRLDNGPRFESNAPQRFSGMGVYGVTDPGMRQSLKKGYLEKMRQPFTFREHFLDDRNIRWTQVSRLLTGA